MQSTVAYRSISLQPSITLRTHLPSQRNKCHNWKFLEIQKSFLTMKVGFLQAYYHIVQSIRCYEKGQKQARLEHLQGISIQLKPVFRIYYENVVDSKIPRHVFTTYIQGFHGWAAGELVEDEYVEYDGTSGAHLVLFNVLDYPFGLEPSLTSKIS